MLKFLKEREINPNIDTTSFERKFVLEEMLKKKEQVQYFFQWCKHPWDILGVDELLKILYYNKSRDLFHLLKGKCYRLSSFDW